MHYRIHHLGVLCDDLEASALFYEQVLGHERIASFSSAGEYDFCFLGSGSELLLELIGQPFSAREAAYVAERGPSFHHLAFSVADAEASFAELSAAGLQVAWEPEDFLFVRHFGVFDDSGILIEILEEKESLPKPASAGQPVDFLLHHFDIFSRDWERTRAFYGKHFGFKSVFEYIYEGGGAFMYLADPDFDPDRRQAMIEVIGPPYVEDREFVFSDHFGTGMDHIGYVVINVPAAYQKALARGTREFVKPYLDYGTEMCWIQDADGNDLELMLPVSKDRIAEAFRSGNPYRPAFPPLQNR